MNKLLQQVRNKLGQINRLVTLSEKKELFDDIKALLRDIPREVWSADQQLVNAFWNAFLKDYNRRAYGKAGKAKRTNTSEDGLIDYAIALDLIPSKKPSIELVAFYEQVTNLISVQIIFELSFYERLASEELLAQMPLASIAQSFARHADACALNASANPIRTAILQGLLLRYPNCTSAQAKDMYLFAIKIIQADDLGPWLTEMPVYSDSDKNRICEDLMRETLNRISIHHERNKQHWEMVERILVIFVDKKMIYQSLSEQITRFFTDQTIHGFPKEIAEKYSNIGNIIRETPKGESETWSAFMGKHKINDKKKLSKLMRNLYILRCILNIFQTKEFFPNQQRRLKELENFNELMNNLAVYDREGFKLKQKEAPKTTWSFESYGAYVQDLSYSTLREFYIYEEVQKYIQEILSLFAIAQSKQNEQSRVLPNTPAQHQPSTNDPVQLMNSFLTLARTTRSNLNNLMTKNKVSKTDKLVTSIRNTFKK